MSSVPNFIPSGHRRRLLVLFILMAVLGTAIFAGARWQRTLPVAEAAPPAAPSAQISQLSSARAYIQFTVDGELIQGDVTQAGYEDWSDLYSFSQSMIIGRLRGGGPEANPMTVTKAIDRSSPLLLQALLRNSVVMADIKVLRPSPTGTEEEALTYRLDGGRIAGHRINVNSGDADFETETLSLDFTTLIMTFIDTEVEYDSTQ